MHQHNFFFIQNEVFHGTYRGYKSSILASLQMRK